MTEIKVLRACLVRMAPMDCEVRKVTLDLLDLLAVMDVSGRLVPLAPPDLLEPWLKARKCRDLQVRMELTELQDCREILDRRERWEPEETRDPEEWLERMACKVLLVLRGRRGEWETSVSLDSKVRRETKDQLGSWDLLVYREPLACLASPASKGSLASRETQDRRGGRETLALLGWTGRTEWTASRDCEDCRETEESLERTEVLEYRV